MGGVWCGVSVCWWRWWCGGGGAVAVLVGRLFKHRLSTSQAMAIFYDVFEEGEKSKAFEVLLQQIEQTNRHMDTGILGARVIFHVLSAFGYSDLALDMIITPSFPSYGHWLQNGATSLWEDFTPMGGKVNSLNHHFFGDISGWFIKCIAGINVNPFYDNINEVQITPCFIEQLNYAKAYHLLPSGKLEVEWRRTQDNIELNIAVPDTIVGNIILKNNYTFEDGLSIKTLTQGEYRIIKN